MCGSIRRNSGDNNEEEIPVPISNTEVKLLSAEDTSEIPHMENRSLPDFLFFNRYIYENQFFIYMPILYFVIK